MACPERKTVSMTGRRTDIKTRQLLNQQYEAWASLPTWCELVCRVLLDQPNAECPLLNAGQQIDALPIATTSGAFGPSKPVELPTSEVVLNHRQGATRTLAALSRREGLYLSFQDFGAGQVLCSNGTDEHALAWEAGKGGAQQTVVIVDLKPLRFEDSFLSCPAAADEADVVWCVVSDVHPEREIAEYPFKEFLSECLQDAASEAEWVVVGSASMPRTSRPAGALALRIYRRHMK